jgi:hypothetical protein
MKKFHCHLARDDTIEAKREPLAEPDDPAWPSARVAVVTASGRSLPALMYAIDAGVVSIMTCTVRRSNPSAQAPRHDKARGPC